MNVNTEHTVFHIFLWLQLRPARLLCLIVAVVYHPPGADDNSIRDHLFHSLVLAESKFPNCGIYVAGDFFPVKANRQSSMSNLERRHSGHDTDKFEGVLRHTTVSPPPLVYLTTTRSPAGDTKKENCLIQP